MKANNRVYDKHRKFYRKINYLISKIPILTITDTGSIPVDSTTCVSSKTENTETVHPSSIVVEVDNTGNSPLSRSQLYNIYILVERRRMVIELETMMDL